MAYGQNTPSSDPLKQSALLVTVGGGEALNFGSDVVLGQQIKTIGVFRWEIFLQKGVIQWEVGKGCPGDNYRPI